jgi:hypothetical protein
MRDDIPESWRDLFDSDEKPERGPGVSVELIEAAGASIGQLCEKLTLYAGWLGNVRLSEARESARIFHDSQTRDSSVLLLRLAAIALERLGHPEQPVLPPIDDSEIARLLADPPRAALAIVVARFRAQTYVFNYFGAFVHSMTDWIELLGRAMGEKVTRRQIRAWEDGTERIPAHVLHAAFRLTGMQSIDEFIDCESDVATWVGLVEKVGLAFQPERYTDADVLRTLVGAGRTEPRKDWIGLAYRLKAVSQNLQHLELVIRDTVAEADRQHLRQKLATR